MIKSLTVKITCTENYCCDGNCDENYEECQYLTYKDGIRACEIFKTRIEEENDDEGELPLRCNKCKEEAQTNINQDDKTKTSKLNLKPIPIMDNECIKCPLQAGCSLEEERPPCAKKENKKLCHRRGDYIKCHAYNNGLCMSSIQCIKMGV